jgi:tetratricopeptide (TPR) repeat protein
MKKRTTYILLSIFTIFLLFACNPQREASDLLRQARKIIDTQPDEALRLIDSIFSPERSLSSRDYMSYLIARVQARYKNHLPIDNDTLIFNAKRYFTKHNTDPQQTALAHFYSGVVYLEMRDSKNAMLHYKQAADYSANTQDINLQGFIQFNIGKLLEEGGLYTEALEKYKNAEQFYANSFDGVPMQAQCFAAIGQMYMLSGKKNNAFVAFYKGLELAKNDENNQMLTLLMQNIYVTYANVNEYEKAADYLRQSFALNNDTTKLPRYYLNFAKLYANTNQSDSLAMYIDKLKQTMEQSDDLYFKVAVYHFLTTIAKENNDISAVFDYSQKELTLVEEISRKRLEQSVYEVQQRYDFQKYQNKHAQALLKRQRISIILLISFLSISLVAIVMYRRTLHQKNRLLSFQKVINTLKQENNQVLSQIQAIEQNNTQLLSEQLSKAQLWKFDSLLRSMLVKAELGDKIKISASSVVSRFSTAIFGKENPEQWNILAEMMEELHPNLLSFIKVKYPLFNDTQNKVAVLSFVNIQPKDIALILGKQPATIYMARTEIRNIMDLSEKSDDFSVVMQQAYNSAKK